MFSSCVRWWKWSNGAHAVNQSFCDRSKASPNSGEAPASLWPSRCAGGSGGGEISDVLLAEAGAALGTTGGAAPCRVRPEDMLWECWQMGWKFLSALVVKGLGKKQVCRSQSEAQASCQPPTFSAAQPAAMRHLLEQAQEFQELSVQGTQRESRKGMLSRAFASWPSSSCDPAPLPELPKPQILQRHCRPSRWWQAGQCPWNPIRFCSGHQRNWHGPSRIRPSPHLQGCPPKLL